MYAQVTPLPEFDSEAEVRNRERILTNNILTNYAEALGALREIDTLEKVLELDMQTTKFVQIRVNEGETAPLEIGADIDRQHAAEAGMGSEGLQHPPARPAVAAARAPAPSVSRRPPG